MRFEDATPLQSESAPVQRVVAEKADRTPPHSLEAEQGVLGCMFLDPKEAIDICVERIGCGTSHFYDLRHNEIYGTLLSMHDRQQPIDLITVQQVLRDRNMLDEVGGLAYLSSLQEAVPSASNIEFYLSIIREKHTARTLLQSAQEAVQGVYDSIKPTTEVLDALAASVTNLSNDGIKTERTIKDVAKSLLGRLSDEKNGIYKCRMPMALPLWDRIYGGFEAGDLVIFAGRPSQGKSSLMFHLARATVFRREFVGIISLEMMSESVLRRMTSGRCGFSLKKPAELNEAQMQLACASLGYYMEAPLAIEDTPGLSVRQIASIARKWKRKHKLRLLVVDYLQLVHGGKRYGPGDRVREIADITTGLKSLAKELEIPVVVGCQFNRAMESDKRKKPKLSNLRESGSLEQDADWVLAPWYRDMDGDDDSGNERSPDADWTGELVVLKNRDGATGSTPLVFSRPTGRFTEPSQIPYDA